MRLINATPKLHAVRMLFCASKQKKKYYSYVLVLYYTRHVIIHFCVLESYTRGEEERNSEIVAIAWLVFGLRGAGVQLHALRGAEGHMVFCAASSSSTNSSPPYGLILRSVNCTDKISFSACISGFFTVYFTCHTFHKLI